MRGRTSGWQAGEGARFVLATITLSVMYLAIQGLWHWGGATLARTGWMYGDPVRIYASQAAEVARQSARREAQLASGYARSTFRLGIEYGFLSAELTHTAASSEASQPARTRSIEEGRQALMVDARLLGLEAVEPLVPRTTADRTRLLDRLENDDGGAAARVETVSSVRLRHLFMLGAYVGFSLSLLSQLGELPIPLSDVTIRHAILAGVPEPLWRPLTRFTEAERTAVLSAYKEHVTALDRALRSP